MIEARRRRAQGLALALALGCVAGLPGSVAAEPELGPVLISGLARDGFQDKELIAVDVSGGRHDGNVYVVWTEFPPSGATSRILFSRSTDGAKSFSKAQRLSEPGVVQAAMHSRTTSARPGSVHSSEHVPGEV